MCPRQGFTSLQLWVPVGTGHPPLLGFLLSEGGFGVLLSRLSVKFSEKSSKVGHLMVRRGNQRSLRTVLRTFTETQKETGEGVRI